MQIGLQRLDLRPGRLPQRCDGGSRIGAGVGLRRQHHFPALIQIGARSAGSALLGAGNRVAGHEIDRARAERRTGRRDDVDLGATGVGDDGARLQMRR